MRQTIAGLAFVAAASFNAGAQPGAPAGWRWALDAPANHVTQTDVIPAGTFSFVSMAPGYHVTMGPGAALYDPRNVTSDRFILQSRLALFPGEAAAEYGLFVGGQRLDSSSASWVAFVVRRDGSAAVLRRANGVVEEVMPWTKHNAIKGGAQGAANVVRVVQDTAVHFLVNDSTIATFARSRVATEGVFGFRIGPALNLHITTLDITHRLAPVPVRR
jgi:hypothetical protein